MTLWDTITGQRRPSNRSSGSSSILQDTAPRTTFDSASLQAEDSSSLLNNAALANLSQLHPLAGLDSSSLDYLTLDESALSDLPGSQSALPSRGWSDDLSYGTGTTYLTALCMGGMWGFVEGSRRTPSSAPFKLRVNSVLNSVTRRGPFLANSAGVIALVYNGINSTIGYYRGKHDWANSIVAGGASGMLYKSTRGVRPMMISGGLVAGAAAMWTAARKTLI